jgi:hypothetical protein
MFESKIDPRSDNASREDPFGNIKRNVGLNLSRPFIKGQEIDCSEGIDGVDGRGDYEREPQICICEGIEARCGVEII